MAFDTTSITSVPASATLYIYCSTNFTSDLIVVKVTAASSFSTSVNVATTNYSNIQGYSLGQDWTGFVTDYSSVASFFTSGWNAIPLNSTALSDMNSLTQFKLSLVNYTYDYLYNAPILSGVATGITALTNAPYIVYTSFGNKVYSIPFTSVAKVNDVLNANIANVT
jgi:hypothetical protein